MMIQHPLKGKIIARGLTLCAAIMSTGCVSLLPDAAPAPSIYRLTQSPVSVASVSGAPTVRVAMPDAAKALQGMDVVVSPDGQRLAYAAGARWASPIPGLLQDAALQSLGQYGRITAIAPPTVVRTDYALETRIRAFEAAFDQGPASPPLAKFRISATLTKLETREVIGKREFYAEKRTGEVRVTSIVNTLDTITQTVMTEMSDWIVESVNGQATPES